MTQLLIVLLTISAIDVFGLIEMFNYSIRLPYFYIHISDALFIIIILIAIVQVASKKIENDKLFYPLLLFVGYSAIHLVLAIYEGTPVRNALRLTMPHFYLLLSLAVPGILKDRRLVESVCRYLVILIMLSLVVVLFQTLTGFRPGFAETTGYISYSYLTQYGFYRVYNPSFILIIFGFCLTYAKLYLKVTFVSVVCFIMCVIAIILNFSRINYLAAIIILMITPMIIYSEKKIVNLSKKILIFTVIFVIFWFSIGNIFVGRFGTLFEDVEYEQGTVAERLAMSYVAFEMLKEKGLLGLLLGFGPRKLVDIDTYGIDVRGMGKDEVLLLSLSSGADMGWVDLLFRDGVLGIIMFIYFITVALKLIYQECQRQIDLRVKTFMSAVILFICYGCIFNFAGNFFLYPVNSIIVGILLGLARTINTSKMAEQKRTIMMNNQELLLTE